MGKKWDGSYFTITHVRSKGDAIKVTFANKDVVKIKHMKLLEMKHPKRYSWENARVVDDGTAIMIPSESTPREDLMALSGARIREYTDKKFASAIVEIRKNQMQYIGARILELRKKRNLTQEELAIKMGTSKDFVEKIENGWIYGLVVFLMSPARMLTALDCTFSDFFPEKIKKDDAR